ncbi:hypothetical protein ILUMI_01416 [Ignelater luminosus]|uniref:Ankyrin repeat protein n=1 Tax=Ignelater luminosus TaxID=2038154 RepID=A0A8K0DQS8_IGNLU|nr:hypothetical protein ILUMI_01416 [Ignelater luminosus]
MEKKMADREENPFEIQLLNYITNNEPVDTIRAFIKSYPETLTRKIDYPEYKPIFYIACSKLAKTINPNIVEALIESGANLYHTDKLHYDKEALHFATLGGNAKILQIIIKSLKPDKINSLSNENTALNLLIKEGNSEDSDFIECIQFLIHAGILILIIIIIIYYISKYTR